MQSAFMSTSLIFLISYIGKHVEFFWNATKRGDQVLTSIRICSSYPQSLGHYNLFKYSSRYRSRCLFFLSSLTLYNNISHTNLTQIYKPSKTKSIGFSFRGLLVLDNLSSSYHIQSENDCYVLSCMLF